MLSRRQIMWTAISKIHHKLWKLEQSRDSNPDPFILSPPSYNLGNETHYIVICTIFFYQNPLFIYLFIYLFICIRRFHQETIYMNYVVFYTLGIYAFDLVFVNLILDIANPYPCISLACKSLSCKSLSLQILILHILGRARQCCAFCATALRVLKYGKQ